MDSEDFVRRFLFEDLDIRGALVRLGPAFRAMCHDRHYPAVVTRLLGEAAAVTVLVGSNLKQPGRLSVQLQGNGQIPLLLLECNEQLDIRGMAKHHAPEADANLDTLIGDGKLAITLQPEHATRPYQSLVPVDGETMAEVFEHFLEQSEQAPAHLVLLADADAAVGLFLQKLPKADQRDPDGWNRVLHLAATLTPQELRGMPIEQLLHKVFPEENVRLFGHHGVRYYCPKDWEKVCNMLRSLGRAEIEDILREHGEIVIHDDICNHEYRFSPEEARALFEDGSRTLH
jgi:molecular chaperone Hsp33